MSGKLIVRLLAGIVCLCWQASVAAQIWTVPENVLDSIANPVEAAGSSLMKFDTKRIVAGDIEETDRPSAYEFRFRNCGEKPLAIRKVTTSCGCARAVCDRMSVPPGDSGRVSVTYYPKGHVGKFERRIFVYTDLSESRPTAVLSLAVNVRQGEDRSLWFPHLMGKIRMKTKGLAFDRDMKDIVCVGFLNSGDTVVSPGVAREFLPAYIDAWCESSGVEPGKEGEICISFDPEKFRENASPAALAGEQVKIPLILTGLGVPPSESSIMLTIN